MVNTDMRNKAHPHNYLNRWIMLLLAGLMILSVALARQGYDIARSQQQVINSLLRDYAELIADNYGRSLLRSIGYGNIYRLVQTLGEAELLQSGIQQWPADRVDEIAVNNIGAPLQGAFLLSGDDGSTVQLLGEPGEAVNQVQQWRTERGAGFGQSFRILHWDEDATTQTVLIIPASNGNDIIALQFNPETLQQLIGKDVDSHELLPEALGDSDAIRPFVHIQVKDTQQRVIYRSSDYSRTYNSASKMIQGDDYAGLFSGFSVSVIIERQATSLLAIGQYTHTNLNGIMILMGMTIILGCSALLLLRRERKLIALRKDFIARVSHELRTPLTQIRMYAESILLGRLPEKTEQTRALEVIHRETQRLSHLVDNVLRFSGSKEQQHRPEDDAYPVIELLEHLHEDFLPMLSARQTTLDIECDADITTHCHRESMLQILSNLTDNALKYGPTGQVISLQVNRYADFIRICLTDQGPGIPERYRKKIFAPYFRLERETERAIAGTGIGLSVASELAEQLGGSLEVVTAEHSGSRFCLTLPGA